MPLRVLTDEHLSPHVARNLAKLGFDVVCVLDRSLLTLEDWELMAWCITHQRAICTKNRRHFEREHRQHLARGQDHYGILIIGDWTPDEIYWALRQFLEADPERELLNQILYLAKASPDFIQARAANL